MTVPKGTTRVALTLTEDGAKPLRTMAGWHGVSTSRVVESALALFHRADSDAKGNLDLEDMVRQWRATAAMTGGRGIVSSIVLGGRPQVGPDAEIIGGGLGDLTREID